MEQEQHEYDDIYTPYEKGLETLKSRLETEYPDRLGEFHPLESRLLERIDRARRFGDTPTNNSELHEIIAQLNRLAQNTIHQSFNDLCPPSKQVKPVPSPIPHPQHATNCQDEDPVMTWLRSMGFRNNPFDTSSAAEEDGDYLSAFFLKARFFDRLAGNSTRPRNVILFAPRGYGKTACRLQVARIARENTTSPVLPVHLVEFDPLVEIVQQQGSPLFLSSYIPLIVRHTLKELTIELEKDSTRKTRLEKNRAMTARFCALQTLYVEPDHHIFLPPPASTFDMEHYYQQTPLSLRDYLKTLVALAQGSGFASVYVLIDGVDETAQTNNDLALALELVRPMLESPGTFEGTGVGLKFFLPDTLETLMYQQHIGRLDRIRTYRLKWKDDDLRAMWGLRLSSYSRVSETESKGVVNSFYVLCEGEDDVDSILIKASQGSPRTLVALGRDIVETHCDENNPSERDLIPMATVHEVLERWL